MLDGLTLRPLPVVSTLQSVFDAFLLSREAMRCTPKTLVHYRYTCQSFVRFLQEQGIDSPAAITPQHVRAYLVSLQRRGLKDTTQHAHARGIKTWLRWLEDEGDIPRNPMAKVAMPRLEQRIPPPFSRDDVRTLLSACDRHTAIGARNFALVMTLLDTGLRASELMAMKVGDVDMRTGLCTVLGKGRKMRQVRVGSKARQALVRMLGYRQGVTPGGALWVVYGRQGQETAQALTPNGLQTVLRRLGKQTGVQPCSPHRFRRTFALWCLRDGMDLHSLRMLMGHSSLAVLQRYLALAGEDVERAHKAHSPADKLLE
ncbi:MAG: tyrosine-type recombinase/integrase [Anaerolineae bacterium]|jgi:integrase/recombinase XerC|nr:tyrosine-type recombinase/integrase [Chloroflexota bacterium]